MEIDTNKSVAVRNVEDNSEKVHYVIGLQIMAELSQTGARKALFFQ